MDLLGFLPIFQRAVPGVFDLVARTTLRESTTGDGYELRCPREYEAQIVDYARAFDEARNMAGPPSSMARTETAM